MMQKELCFLYTELLLIKFYLSIKFQVDTSYSFCVMLRTKLWRMDERKAKAAAMCSRWQSSKDKLYPNQIWIF